MPLESVSDIGDLNPAWPLGSDPQSDGDNHIRNIKTAVRSLLTDLSQIGITVVELTLTSPSTVISYTGPKNLGGLVTYIIKQDSSGGRQISWDSGFVGAGPGIDLTPNKGSVFQFVVNSNSKLVLCSMPLLGVQL